MWGSLALAAIIVIVILVFKVAKKFNLSMPTFAKSVQFWKLIGMAIGIILFLILLGYGANYVWNNRGVIAPYASAVLALLVLAFVGILWIFKKVGTVGAWALGTLGVLVVFFGVRTPEFVMTAQGAVSGVVLDGKPVFETKEVVQPEKVVITQRGSGTLGSRAYTLAVNPTTREWSERIRVYGVHCFWAPTVDEDNAQASEQVGGEMMDWNVYHAKRNRGEVGFPKEVRVRSDGTQTAILYELRQRNTCP